MTKRTLAIFSILALFFLVIFAMVMQIQGKLAPQFSDPVVLAKKNYFTGFDKDTILEEAGKISETRNRFWWLNSGGLFYVEKNVAKTIQGDSPATSRWRHIYDRTNPRDTDRGLHPQNIFRLVTRGKWQNFRQEVYFKVKKENLSASDFRNSSNGVFLFNRYQDGNNLYYTGVRVDGYAVIKKKIGGDYYTLAMKKVYSGKYNPEKNPNLLPKNVRIGVRSEVRNLPNNVVNIKFYVDTTGKGSWKKIFDIKDQGTRFGGPPVTKDGHAGLRTDFMDVEFDSYKIEKL